MYIKAVWLEDGKEMEGTIPDNWIDINSKTVRWPMNKSSEAFKKKKDPQDDWLVFPSIKKKLTSGMF